MMVRGGRPVSRRSCLSPPHQVCELLINDLYHLLTRGQALKDFLAYGALTDILHQFFDHLVIDVRFEQGETHLLEGILNVFFT